MKNKGKNKPFVAGVIITSMGAWGLFAAIKETEDVSSLVGGSLLFLFIGVILLVCASISDNKKRNAPALTPTPLASDLPPIPPQKAPKVQEGERDYNLFEVILNGWVLRYEYEDRLCLDDGAINLIINNGGAPLTFRQEPDNPHDGAAVAVYLGDNKLGYIYRGNIQKMINDWIKRGELFSGYINKYSTSDNSATYKIGFYKPLNKYKSKRFEIVKTGKRSCDGLA